MRLSTVLELLVIALLIAFAASRVIEVPADNARTLSRRHRFSARKGSQEAQVTAAPVAAVTAATLTPVAQDLEMTPIATGPSKICTCSSLTCNCCRDFSLPVVPVKGPGCATVSYLHDNAMMITMSFGDRVLRNITVNSKKPKPICMSMPGGVSRFCGRLYSIKREGDNFKACLGLELRALDDVEAAVRVSCFRFGPGGVNVEPGEAFPAEKIKEEEDEDDDDYGLGALGDDDDDDDDFGLTGGGDDDDEDDEEEVETPPQRKDVSYNDVDSSDSDSDYTGLSSFSDEIFGGLFGSSKKTPIASFIDDDDDDDDYDDDDDDEEDVPEPPKSQVVAQNSPVAPQPQVNLVVMHPVIIPSPSAPSPKPAIQRRPGKRPVKVKPSSPPERPMPSTEAMVQPTTAPLKTTQTTTPTPVKTLGTSTTSPVVPEREATTPKNAAKKKKKKKPSRRRRPTTAKPILTPSETTPSVVTTSTMTVNVVQGEVKLNQTKPQQTTNSESEQSSKVPMSKPVLETKPADSTKEPENLQMSEANKYSVTNSMMANEFTTQTILQNTIPVDDIVDEKLRPLQEITTNKPSDLKSDAAEDLTVVSTTPNVEKYNEGTTNQDTTVQESMSYTNGAFVNNMWHSDKATTMLENETTERYSQPKDEMTTENESNGNSKEVQTTVVDQTSSATEPYDTMEEATDKTEAIVHSNEHKTEQSSHDEEENDDDDEDDDIDIGADLGLEDDDEEENNEKKPVINAKPTDKFDDDEDDMFGEILDDDDEEDKSKEEEEDRALKSSVPYKINPLLYRLARVSSGSVATARHLPRFSEGRNRRNNKRMRFPSLEITS